MNRIDFKTKNSPGHGITRRAFLKKAGGTTAVIAVASAAPELIPIKSKAWAKGEYDIIIKGGTLYDGISPEPRLADVAIKGDKIVAIGEVQSTAVETIDARDLIVTPGFIDVHPHCDVTFKRTGWKRYLSYFMPSWKGNYNYLYQGVTTVVSGNCGYGYSDTKEWFGMFRRKEIERAIKEVFSYLGADKILISFYPGEDSYEGKTLKQINEETGKHPAECYAHMVCDEQPPIGIFFYLKTEDVRALMKPDFILTSSDGWTVPKDMTKPHPRCYGTFPKKIRDFAIREEMLDLPKAIRSMTSLPAEKFKFKGRGKVMEEYYADLAVIDLKRMTAHATYLEPHQYATGIKHLLVNGILSIADGKATGDRGGKALRRS